MAKQVPSFNPSMPFFCIPKGVVTEKRPLKTQKGDTWAYVFSVATLGATFEVQTKDQAVYESIEVTREGRWLCKVETYQQRTNLIFQQFDEGAGALAPISLTPVSGKGVA